ncbi:phage distal tail protein [Rhodococcus qingshengii]|uniref:phage distal tail protein n=1 Tax=Rhodococcus qingshengii TaxID=334542 RepID=UPI00294377E2|nr:phage tail domain-containing protein [Rhodococcus qingshengii]WOI85999.1 phage tail family protein [Rhodococcus qingshengii]
MIGVKYGSFNMQGNGFRVTETDVYNAPENSIQADAMAERDGSLVVKQQYKSKIFKVEGWFRKDSLAEAEQARDAFMLAMSRKNQPFDIEYAGGIRRYLASAQNIIVSKLGASSFGFSVQFLSPDGMGWDTSSTALIASASVTTSSAEIPVSVKGTYKAEPATKVQLFTVTGGTAKSVSIGNASTLRQIQITRDWVSSDVIDIDTLNGVVRVNGIDQDFIGQLPEFEPGDNALSYVDNFTDRDVTITGSYTSRWL